MLIAKKDFKRSDDRVAGIRNLIHHEYDYKLNWTTQSPVIK